MIEWSRSSLRRWKNYLSPISTFPRCRSRWTLLKESTHCPSSIIVSFLLRKSAGPRDGSWIEAWKISYTSKCVLFTSLMIKVLAEIPKHNIVLLLRLRSESFRIGALSLHHYFHHLMLAWVSMGILDESHWQTSFLLNMNVLFHSSGAMSRADYAIVRKVESASMFPSGNQHNPWRSTWISYNEQLQVAQSKLSLVCAVFLS